MSETREQVIVEDIGAELGALKENDTHVTKAGNSKGCNTTANGL